MTEQFQRPAPQSQPLTPGHMGSTQQDGMPPWVQGPVPLPPGYGPPPPGALPPQPPPVGYGPPPVGFGAPPTQPFYPHPGSGFGSPSPFAPAPQRRSSLPLILIGSGVAVLILLVLVGTGLALTGSLPVLQAHPDGYLYNGQTEVDFLQLIDTSNGQFTGQLQAVYAKSDGSGVQSLTDLFTGIRNGSSISLNISGTMVVGTLNGDTLSLVWPQQDGTLATIVFKGASVQDYNAAVQALRQRYPQQSP
jgi:hypothetical protein